MLSQTQLVGWFHQHRRRLKAGDGVPDISEIARRAAVHRDTVYALLAGDRISARSQYALSRIVEEVEAETAYMARTRVMTISLGAAGPRIGFGANSMPVLCSRSTSRR